MSGVLVGARIRGDRRHSSGSYRALTLVKLDSRKVSPVTFAGECVCVAKKQKVERAQPGDMWITANTRSYPHTHRLNKER